MTYSELGRTGIKVSRVCLGTMTWGQQNSEAEGHAQMDYAVSRGVNFFDTAEVYAVPPKAETYGATETIIGNWFKKTGKRQDIVLASKVTGREDMMKWIRGGPRHTRAHIDEAVEGSLRRLQTDYIDLYQLHWPDRRYPGFGFHSYVDYDADYEAFETILESLDAHIKKGNIRHFGVSNESPWGLMRFIAESDKRGLPRPASIQNCYNLVTRVFEYGLAEVSLREQVGLLAYSPLAQGYLTGKYQGGARPEGARKTLFERLGRYERPGGIEAIDAYVELARSLGWQPEQFALKFVDTRPFVTSTIIGATTMEQLKTDIDAFELEWTKKLEAQVDKVFKLHRSPAA